MWVAGKLCDLSLTRAIPERFRGGYRTHYKALYKIVLFTYLLTYLLAHLVLAESS